MLEHGAYNLLLDYYYSDEQPLPLDRQELYLMLRAMRQEDRKAVDKVLGLFFTIQQDGYHQKRVDHEIAVSKKARENGKHGGRPITGQQTDLLTEEGGGSVHPPTSNLQPPTTNRQPPENSTTLSGDARPMSWGFVAGIIDGEACVRLNRYEQNGQMTITPRITIYNTNLALLEEIKSKIGMGSISGRERSNPNSKDLHELNFKRDEIAQIVSLCSQHIVAKKQQFSMLEDFLAHWPSDKAYCEELYERTKNLNARGKPDAPKLNGNGKLHADAVEILGVLNATAGRNYKPVKANLEMIEARLKEGATADEIKAVIGRKCSQWGADEKMAEYLRPATLFNRTKFAQYQGELGSYGRPEWMRDVI